MSLLAVDEALVRVLDGAARLGVETVALAAAHRRVLAGDLVARRTQPPFDAAAMDGYAVQAADLSTVPATLTIAGEAVAGRGFAGSIASGEAVRIFTGAPVPAGADTILIQENAERDGNRLRAIKPVAAGRHIRKSGLDFREGDRVLPDGTRLGPAQLALAAAANHDLLQVARPPRVALIATGDELVAPGGSTGPDQIIASNGPAVAAIIAEAGGTAFDLGIVEDDERAIAARIRAALDADADVIVTLGGASVGDHDLVRDALGGEGMALDFWRIAMRPGKPLLSGNLGRTRVLGLPGNPVSSLVCALVFLAPVVRALCGVQRPAPQAEYARLGSPLAANDGRQDYVRAALDLGADGTWRATPFPVQDSSMLSVMAGAAALIIREPHAPAAAAGSGCRILRLP